MYYPSAVEKKPKINAAISETLSELAPSVVQIRHEFREDWTGAWAVYFLVTLSDEVCDRRNLREVTNQVVSKMMDRLDLPTLGLFPYFSFLSQSEEASIDQPAVA